MGYRCMLGRDVNFDTLSVESLDKSLVFWCGRILNVCVCVLFMMLHTEMRSFGV